MRLLKQPYSLKIDDFITAKLDKHLSTPPPPPARHGVLFPNSIRCIITGPSNCGKTNLMLNLLEHINGLRFENVYVYSKSLYQPIYQYLKKLLAPIKDIKYFEFNDNENIMSPSEARKNSIFIFDDVACEKQSVMRDFFAMGRHNLIDSFYLTQTYAHIPKHLVRDNANMLVLFKQDNMNLKHIYNDHVNTDMSFEIFYDMCSECWTTTKHGFLVICKDFDLNCGRYRKGFDIFIAL